MHCPTKIEFFRVLAHCVMSVYKYIIQYRYTYTQLEEYIPCWSIYSQKIWERPCLRLFKLFFFDVFTLLYPKHKTSSSSKQNKNLRPALMTSSLSINNICILGIKIQYNLFYFQLMIYYHSNTYICKAIYLTKYKT